MPAKAARAGKLITLRDSDAHESKTKKCQSRPVTREREMREGGRGLPWWVGNGAYLDLVGTILGILVGLMGYSYGILNPTYDPRKVRGRVTPNQRNMM